MKQLLNFVALTFLSGVLSIFVSVRVHAQSSLEGLIVETYYVATTADNEPPFGGPEEGAVTYRIFLDLGEGCNLTRVFADENHTLKVKSTAPFYNTNITGKVFGHEIASGILQQAEVTVLDSYLSMGGAASTYFGIPKTDDSDGSIWAGGTNPIGQLANENSQIGFSLLSHDGLSLSGANSSTVPNPFLNTGDAVLDTLQKYFGNGAISHNLESNNFILFAPSGVPSLPNGNKILIGQLTTHGELELQFNIKLRNAEGEIETYVAEGSNLQQGEVISPFLKYPMSCGCTDPDFIEFNAAAGCDDGSCQELIAFGCTNPDACNYDSLANFSVPELCCFVDSCQGLDPTLICETLGVEEPSKERFIVLYPVPTGSTLHMTNFPTGIASLDLTISDMSGHSLQHSLKDIDDKGILSLDVSKLPSGIYMITAVADGFVERKTFVVRN